MVKKKAFIDKEARATFLCAHSGREKLAAHPSSRRKRETLQAKEAYALPLENCLPMHARQCPLRIHKVLSLEFFAVVVANEQVGKILLQPEHEAGPPTLTM